MEQELVEYVERQLKRGVSIEQVKVALREAGYDADLIERVCSLAFQKTGKKFFGKKVFVISVICLVIILISIGYYFRTSALEKKVDGFLSSGWDLYNQSKFEESIGQFNQAVMLDSENEDAHIGLGLSYLKRKMYDLAEKEFNKAVSLNSKNEKGHEGLGWIYLDSERYAEAEEEFNTLLSLNPQSDGAYAGLGFIHYERGEREEGEKEFNKAMELNENRKEVMFGFSE